MGVFSRIGDKKNTEVGKKTNFQLERKKRKIPRVGQREKVH